MCTYLRMSYIYFAATAYTINKSSDAEGPNVTYLSIQAKPRPTTPPDSQTAPEMAMDDSAHPSLVRQSLQGTPNHEGV